MLLKMANYAGIKKQTTFWREKHWCFAINEITKMKGGTQKEMMA